MSSIVITTATVRDDAFSNSNDNYNTENDNCRYNIVVSYMIYVMSSIVGGFEWQFAGDHGWCRYDAAASRLLEAARERNEDMTI